MNATQCNADREAARAEYKAAAGAYRADLRKRNGYIVAAYEAPDFRKELAEARDALAVIPGVPMPRGFDTRFRTDHDEWNSWQIHGFLRSIKSERENEHPRDAWNIRVQRRFDMRRYAEQIGKSRRFVRFPDLQTEPMRIAA